MQIAMPPVPSLAPILETLAVPSSRQSSSFPPLLQPAPHSSLQLFQFSPSPWPTLGQLVTTSPSVIPPPSTTFNPRHLQLPCFFQMTTPQPPHTPPLSIFPITARVAHVFPEWIGSLLSISVLCDHGYSALYTSTTVTILDSSGRSVLSGTRSPSSNLWHLPIFGICI